MDLEGLRRGDPDALGAAIDRCGPWLWVLARRGFECTDSLVLGAPQSRLRVLGTANPDAAAHLTIEILAEALQPEHRMAIERVEDLDREVLERARRVLFRAAEKRARLVGADGAPPTDPPPIDLDRLIDALPEPEQWPTDGPVEPAPEHTAVRAALDGWIATLEAPERQLVELRFRLGTPPEEMAEALGTSPGAISAREAKLRRKAASRARTASDEKLGPYAIDSYLAGAELASLPPRVAWDRLRGEVQSRVHVDPPAPFARRMGWALAALGLGLLGWAGIFFGFLPSVEDDVRAPPAVELRCRLDCTPGSGAHIAVRGTRETSHFGVALRRVDGDGTTTLEPLLVAPDGGTLRLPFGARSKRVPYPVPVIIPGGFEGGAVVAVFSEVPLDRRSLLELADGRRLRGGVVTATAAVGR